MILKLSVAVNGEFCSKFAIKILFSTPINTCIWTWKCLAELLFHLNFSLKPKKFRYFLFYLFLRIMAISSSTKDNRCLKAFFNFRKLKKILTCLGLDLFRFWSEFAYLFKCRVLLYCPFLNRIQNQHNNFLITFLYAWICFRIVFKKLAITKQLTN